MSWEREYFEYLKLGRSEKTVEAYVSDLRQFRFWHERENAEKLHPSRVTGTDCLDFRTFQLEEENVAPSTWNRRRASLIVFTQWAMDQGYLKEDPMVWVEEKKVEELPPRWLDEMEYRSVVRYLDQEVNRAQTDFELHSALMYRAIISLMLYAGLRVGEVCNLEEKDLGIGERKGSVLIRDGKGGKQALLPLNKKARRAIIAWLDYREKAEDSGPHLWYSKRGHGTLSERSVQQYVQNIGKVLEISDLTSHRFRHTFVRRLLVDKKEPINIVQKFARHSRIETTLSYARVSWEDLERAADQL